MLQAVLTLAALLMVHHTTALQQLNDRQSRFVADPDPELKTPLTSMIGYADLLRGGELPPKTSAAPPMPSTMNPPGWKA